MSWLKAIATIFISSFISIVSYPEILSASDSVKVSDLDKSSMVQTVVAPVAQPSSSANTVVVSTNSEAQERLSQKTSPVTPTATIAVEEVITYVPKNYVKFGSTSMDIEVVDSTSANSGNHVNKIGSLLYGHNYTAFGNIKNLGIGARVTVDVNGETKTYKVVDATIYDVKYSACDSGICSKLYQNGVRKTMNGLINSAYGHSLAMMTCHGEADAVYTDKASQRYVVFLDEI